MLSRVFPSIYDNSFRGLAPAYWLLIPVVILKFLMGANAVFITRSVASTADRLPLANFGDAGTQAVLNLLSLWGLEQAMLTLFGILALVRYRAMVPLIYLLLLTEQIGRKILNQVYPIHRDAGPASGGLPIGVIMNYVLLVALMVGTVMALIGFRYSADRGRVLVEADHI